MYLPPDLFAVNQKTAFRFFLSQLAEGGIPARATEAELHYVVSIIAHYAQTSSGEVGERFLFTHMGEVFDHFVLKDALRHDAEMMAYAGSQILMHAGFFRDQVRRRHNVHWYDELGAKFFRRAGALSRERQHAELYDNVGRNFRGWTRSFRNMHVRLRESRYLISQ